MYAQKGFWSNDIDYILLFLSKMSDMKKSLGLLVIAIFSLLHIVVGQSKSYGKKVNEKRAISMAQLSAQMEGKTALEATVTGKVDIVCQAEGCWMKIAKGNGSDMMVRMKDHKFFLPKNIAGKTAVFAGKATLKTTTVEMLKHYAEDEGKSKEYIENIKEPKTELAFEATGVLIK